MLLPTRWRRCWRGSVRHLGRPGIALIAVDLDGTLLTSERVLAPEGVRSLRQAYQLSSAQHFLDAAFAS